MPDDEPASEERKLATVLFADLVGSTALADEEDPERTRLVLNRFYDAMTEEVERCGGTVEKFAGDAVMAAFGAPAALEDHAERGLHAGLAMQRRLGEVFGDRLALRIGVNTGDVVVGQAREGSSFVTGDAVNVAARLEQAAGPGQILAGERTVTAARGAFEFGDPATFEAKGKIGGVMARPVLRALSLMRPRGVRGLPSVFVGREPEFDELLGHYTSAVETGEPHLVSILGEAGVGKTRLTRELWAWLADQSPEPIRRTGRTLSYGQGTTYWPLGEVLKEHFGLSDGESPSAVAERLTEHPYLGLTLGLPSSEELHPLVARERLHDAWVDFVGELVADQPVVLLIEDMHWAEDDLCDLIDTLVAQSSGPLLVLVTARPEMLDRRPAWGGSWRRTSVMRLEALPPADTGDLLDRLIGTRVPREIREIVVDRAEGNPFFVEELIGTFIDHGVIAQSNGSWQFADLPAGFNVPDTVQAVLAARIDLLPPAEKSALQAASVIGRTFWTGPVYELVAGESPDIGLLEDRDFVRRRPGSSLPGEREYVIKHALTREVAYASLTKARRARLHADFAAWLERRAEGHDELAPLLAHHYAEAVRPEDRDLAWAGEEEKAEDLRIRAVAWLRRAADAAVGRYEIDDGLTLLRRAAQLEDDPEAQASLWYAIGHASALKYDGEGLVTAMERALSLGYPESEVYPELAFQTVLRRGMWQRRLEDEIVERWIERALALSPEESPARGRAMFAASYTHDDLQMAEKLHALAERLDDVELRSYAYEALTSAYFMADAYAESVEYVERRMELLPDIGDPDHLAHGWESAADVYFTIGRLREGRTAVERLEATVAGLTPHHRIHGLGMRTLLEHSVADWAAVRELFPRAEDAIEANLATPCPFNLRILLHGAVAFALGGDLAEASRLEAKFESLGMEGYWWATTWPQLDLARARGDRAAARRMLDTMDRAWLEGGAYMRLPSYFDALVFVRDGEHIESDAPRWIRPDTYVAPFAARALGVARNDRALLGDAIARFEAMGLAWHADETRRMADTVGS